MNLNNLSQSEQRAQIAKDTAAWLKAGNCIPRYNSAGERVGEITEKSEEIRLLPESKNVTLYKGFKIIKKGKFDFEVWTANGEACAPTRSLQAAKTLILEVEHKYK